MSLTSISRLSSAPLPQAAVKPAAKLPIAEKVATVEVKNLRGLEVAAKPEAKLTGADAPKKDIASEKVAELVNVDRGLEKVTVAPKAAESVADITAAPTVGEEKQVSAADAAIKDLVNNAAARTADSAYKATQGVSNGSKNGGGVGSLSLAI
jgi:hypothetical protein